MTDTAVVHELSQWQALQWPCRICQHWARDHFMNDYSDELDCFACWGMDYLAKGPSSNRGELRWHHYDPAPLPAWVDGVWQLPRLEYVAATMETAP